MEGDELSGYSSGQYGISIHSLRMEGDLRNFKRWKKSERFQSTPSAWRETQIIDKAGTVVDISIHSLRMEGDYGGFCGEDICRAFQSTPSAWRETIRSGKRVKFHVFQSTPSAWRETSAVCLHKWFPCHFNPLPPHGGRRRTGQNGPP